MLTQALASWTGLHEPSLRLLLGLLFSFIFAYFQQRCLFALLNPSSNSTTSSSFPILRAWLDLILGVSLAYYFCGVYVIYPFLSILITYLICYVCQVVQWNRTYAAGLVFVGNFGFLLSAYLMFASESYDINWTTPQSVLCLRLMSFAMDFADGQPKQHKQKEKEKEKEKENDIQQKQKQVKSSSSSLSSSKIIWAQDLSLPHLPGLLPYLAYAFFPSTFLVGPQFPFQLYQQYLTLELYHPSLVTTHPTTSSSIQKERLQFVFQKANQHAFRCLGLGLMYLILTQWLSMYLNTSFMLTSQFLTYPYYQRWLYGFGTGKLVLSKYLGVWLLSEASCAFNGIAYQCKDSLHSPNQSIEFDGLANIHVYAYETATSLNHIIGSFNINTNHWVKRYIFKRFKQFQSKHLSSFMTLLFLALWHGFHPAYFFVFFLEFIDLQAEAILKTWFAKGGASFPTLYSLLCWFCTSATLYYAVIPFDLLTWHKLTTALNALYWWGHLGVAFIFITHFFITKFMKKRVSSPRSSMHGSKSMDKLKKSN